MPYYFINFDSIDFKDFIEGHDFLRSGEWIGDLNQLMTALTVSQNNSTFLVDFNGPRAKVDDYVLLIREVSPKSKVFYVTDVGLGADLSSHKLTPAGGNDYISKDMGTSELKNIIEDSASPPEFNTFGNRLENSDSAETFDLEALNKVTSHPLSQEMNLLFKEISSSEEKKPKFQSVNNFKNISEDGDLMSDKDQELSLDNLNDLELGSEELSTESLVDDGGLELSLDDSLELGTDDEAPVSTQEAHGDLDLDLSFDEVSDSDPKEEELNLSEDTTLDSFEELSLGDDDGLSLSDDSLDLSDESLDLSGDDSPSLSDEAMEKLKEIDAIMVEDSNINVAEGLDLSEFRGNSEDKDIDQPLVSDDLNLDTLNFGSDDLSLDELEEVQEEKPKKKAKPVKETKARERDLGEDFREISGAYSGEMERTQATIANLRADREELLKKIERLEEDRVMHNRQTLTMRAELDEKKIELSIIRKKMTDEISDLKDRMKIQEERKLILEEKNRVLLQELDKAGQRNRMDVKKVQMRERELEQRLELLKSDAETQIRHRDLKILELKRKIDAMEFDMESITTQEKRSVESRFELEDKLDKAIKTLRSAITVLEDESDKSNALEALKKNIDM